MYCEKHLKKFSPEQFIKQQEIQKDFTRNKSVFSLHMNTSQMFFANLKQKEICKRIASLKKRKPVQIKKEKTSERKSPEKAVNPKKKPSPKSPKKKVPSKPKSVKPHIKKKPRKRKVSLLKHES